MTRRRALLARMESEPVGPIPTGYVKNGLLLWLDAICNTRNGHDVNALYWEDLSGNQRDYAIGSSGLTFGESTASFTTPATHPAIITANGFTDEDRAQIHTNTATIEIGVNFTSAGFQIVLPFGNQHGTTNMYESNRVKYLNFNPTNSNKSVQMLDGLHGYNSELWVDGIQQSPSNFNTTWGAIQADILFAYASGGGFSFVGEVAYFRVYNRKLTDAELMQNWLRDKDRYNL